MRELITSAATRAVSILVPAMLALATLPEAHAQSKRWSEVGPGTPGCCGVPELEASNPRFGHILNIRVRGAAPSRPVYVAAGFAPVNAPLLGGVLVPFPELVLELSSNASGEASLKVPIPHAWYEVPVYLQALVLDPVTNFAFSNAISATFKPHVASDFNGDGKSDLALGAPSEGVGTYANAGAVFVTYGGNALAPQVLHQGANVNGVLSGLLGAGDRFGKALATGDFNGDGYGDLAVSTPYDNQGAVSAGVVQVIYGSASGLQGGNAGLNDTYLFQGSNGLDGVPETNDRFGQALAAGDFDGDGCDDLGIGVPYEETSGTTNHGSVQVVYGSPSGITTVGNEWFNDPGDNGANDYFGWTLAAGDFDGDGMDELVVGHPHEDQNGQANAGAVSLLYPSRGRPGTVMYQGASIQWGSVEGALESGDYFGFSLAVGDFDGNSIQDLAIGVPFEAVGALSDAGAVNVLYGSYLGFTGHDDQIFTQDSSGVMETAEAHDLFGYSLAAGDFDRDRRCDLAVGVPYEDTAGVRHGAVHLFYGTSPSGLSAARDEVVHKDVFGMRGQTAAFEEYGWALFAGDHDGDDHVDLAIGIPGQAVNGHSNAGAVHYVRGESGGVTYLGDLLLEQSSSLPGLAEFGDRTGASLPGSADLTLF